MNALARMRAYFPVLWTALAAVILVGDYFAGPFVAFPVLFIIPVALASRFGAGWWGVALGGLLPLIHFGLTFLWPASWPPGESLLNAALRAGVLMSFAFLISRVTRQNSEIRVLRGMLPICGFCKKIRTDKQDWVPIERYISERSEASFTHGFCPECGKKHYGELLEKMTAERGEPGGDTH